MIGILSPPNPPKANTHAQISPAVAMNGIKSYGDPLQKGKLPSVDVSTQDLCSALLGRRPTRSGCHRAGARSWQGAPLLPGRHAGGPARPAGGRQNWLPASVRQSRQGSEGVALVYIPAQSALAWRRWNASLAPTEAARIRLWRAGVVGAPTRQARRRGFSPQCKLCGAPLASARHLWVECPFFA